MERERSTSGQRTVLWVIGDGAVAGVGRHVLDVADVGIPGWTLRVLAPEGPLQDELVGRGLAVAGLKRFGREHGPMHGLQAVRRALRETEAALVHSHLAWADLIVAGTPTRIPRITTEHGVSGDKSTYTHGGPDQLATIAAHRWRLRRTRGLIAVSEATAEVVRQRWRPPARTEVRVIRNGIDRTPDLRHVANGGFGSVVGYLGRFAPEKRVHLLVEAFASALRARPELRLRLAGGGADEDALRERVDALGIAEAVSFDGWCDGPTWLMGIDVLAVTSVWENCSYSILQALDKGVGVIAAPVGGNPEILPTACLVDPTRPQAFAAAMLSQLNDPTGLPKLPPQVPTRLEMTRAIAATYTSWIGRG